MTNKTLTITRDEYDALTEGFEDNLFEFEGIKIKNIFKKPMNNITKWFDKEFMNKETSEEKENRELALAIQLSLQEAQMSGTLS